MKNNTERNEEIFRLWDEEGLTFQQIAQLKFKGNRSLKRVRNIVYGGPGRLKNDTERTIYRTFRLKFLELKDIPAAIRFATDNQPTEKLSEATIRRVILDKLNQKRK